MATSYAEKIVKKENESETEYQAKVAKKKDFFATLLLDMNKLRKIDVMKSNFRNIVLTLAKDKASHALMTCYVFKYYLNTNDRSNTRQSDKQANCFAYAFHRSTKQLADLLKQDADLIKLLDNKVLTASQYYNIVK